MKTHNINRYMKNKILLFGLCLTFLTSCAMVIHEKEVDKYRTLGVAHIRECTTYVEREDKAVEKCTKIDTEGFSGWEAVMKGIGSMVVRILTLGQV